MNRPLLKRMIPQVITWAAAVVLCAAAAFAQNAQNPPAGTTSGAATAAGQRTDAQIEMDVVKALDASQPLKNDLITAATIQSEVTLAGTVSDQAARELAGKIAASVPGVTKVHNNLTIGNPEQAQNEQAPGESNAGETQVPENEPNAAPAPGEENEPMPAPGQDQGQYPGQSPYPGQPPYPNQPPYPGQPPYPNQPPYPGQSPYPGQPSAQSYPGYPGTQPQYPNPSQQPQYQYPYQQPQQPPAPSYQPAKGPVTIPAGTLLQLRTAEAVNSKGAVDGTPVQFTVIQDVAPSGVLAIPRGATVHGVVTESKNVGSGKLGGSPELALTLTSLDLGGKSYPLQSDLFKVKGPSKTGRTVNSAIGGALLGTIIGCIAGRGVGCAIGAAAGAGAGTAASAAAPGPGAWIPSEALVTFHLTAPLTVNPVSPQEAARLAQGLFQGGPNLYRRGYSPYGSQFYNGSPYGYPYGYSYGYPYSPLYGYPPVFYRPYFMMGGLYYWR
jgi:hypothetical protein